MEIAIMTLKIIFGLSILYVLLWLGFYKLVELIMD